METWFKQYLQVARSIIFYLYGLLYEPGFKNNYDTSSQPKIMNIINFQCFIECLHLQMSLLDIQNTSLLAFHPWHVDLSHLVECCHKHWADTSWWMCRGVRIKISVSSHIKFSCLICLVIMELPLKFYWTQIKYKKYFPLTYSQHFFPTVSLCLKKKKELKTNWPA